MKLVDVLDSKSSGPCVRVGSIPTSGTMKFQRVKPQTLNPFSILTKLSIIAFPYTIKSGSLPGRISRSIEQLEMQPGIDIFRYDPVAFCAWMPAIIPVL